MIKRILLSLILVGGIVMSISLPAQARDILNPACSSGDAGSSAVCTAANPSKNPVIEDLGKITLIIAFVAGAAAIIMILVGSIQYIISDGDSNKVNSAKNTIIYALVGLLVVALSATIIEFVVNKL
jgi:hypothetical protein